MNRPAVPIEIVIEITGKCRLVCPYCTGPRTPNVPWVDIKNTIDEAYTLGIKTLRITGGEPLLHPDFHKILTYAKNKNFAIPLNTAAEDMSRTMLNTVASYVDAALISLQGYDEKTNAIYTRSKSSFADKIKNIFALKAYLPTLWLATVITPTFSKTFHRFLPIVKKINPVEWSLFRAIDTNEEVQSMDLSFYRALTVKILKARKAGINVSIGNAIPMCITGNFKTAKEAFIGGDFDDGHVRLIRSAQGYFKPSYFLDVNLGQTIQSAWANPFLRELDRSEFLPQECQQCPIFNTCRGGCRAMALRAYGTALSKDPLFDPANAQRALSKAG